MVVDELTQRRGDWINVITILWEILGQELEDMKKNLIRVFKNAEKVFVVSPVSHDGTN